MTIQTITIPGEFLIIPICILFLIGIIREIIVMKAYNKIHKSGEIIEDCNCGNCNFRRKQKEKYKL